MNIYLFASVENIWLVTGWTMIHFLWLGTLIALAALVARWLLRRAPANIRYAVALTCLTLLVALPAGIATWLTTNSPPSKGGMAAGADVPSAVVAAKAIASLQSAEAIELHNPDAERTPLAANGIDNPASVVAGTTAEPSPNSSPSGTGVAFVALVETSVPYLPWLWLIGTPITFALTATGLIGTRRLNRASRMINDGPIAESLAKLTASLRISRRVAVAVCDRIASPVLIGIFRPIILLPPAALTGYTIDEIEMVLLHELAHVRRWDNLVNLLQRLVESVLFFHPAVWLISSWVRRERETCCDALVVSHTDHPHAYAELLVALAAQMPRSVLFHPAASSAMAAGPLRSRIRCILKLDDDPMLVSGKSFAIILGALLLSAALTVLYLPTVGQAEPSAIGVTTKNESKSDAHLEEQTKKNLKDLSQSLQNYQVTRAGTLPANAIYDANGKPLLSWRVQILPFLHQQKLYEEFHLNEPWDSEHNRKLIARMPDVFNNPKLNKPGMTNYLAVAGEECVFTGRPRGVSTRDIIDGTALTIALVEANPELAVEWTKPQDWNFDRANPTNGLGQVWPGGWYAAWVGGNVRRIENSEPADRIGIQFTRAGRETQSLKESANPPSAEGPAAADAVLGPEGGPSAEALPLAFELKSGEFGKTAIFLNDKPIDEDGIRVLIRQLDTPGAQAVSLRAGKAIKYAEVMKVIDLIESLGVKKLALDTRLVESSDERLGVTSSEDWPNAVPFPNPSDAEVSKHAWQRLGLKLLPGTGGHPSLVIYQNPFSKDSDLGLTAINDTQVGNFDQLAFSLRRLPDNKSVTIHCTDYRPSGAVELWFTVKTPGKYSALRRYLSPAIITAWSQNARREPTGKESSIGMEAFNRLGILLATANPNDNYLYKGADGLNSFVKIVGGNLPGEIPNVSLLTHIGSAEVTDLESVFSILAKLQKESAPHQIQCIAQAGIEKFVFEGGPIRPETPQVNSDATNTDQTKSSPTDTTSAGATAARAASESVLAEFSSGEDYGEKLLKIYAEGYGKKLRLDLVNRNGKQVLIGVPQPTEKDWPTMLGDPPLKQRVLGEQIWQALGLKVAPLTQAEASYQELTNQNGGVLIVGGNVPKGLPLRAILTTIGGQKVTNLDDVLSQLGPDNAPPVQYRCHAVADGNEYLFDSQWPTANKAANPSEPKREAARTTPSNRFPSLENQKLADLAYKHLGLELEPIGPDDLKRVKTLGYDGGAKVAAVKAPSYDSVQVGDILVGLHVWPTTNLKDIAQILNRDDLKQLDPLKFYVVREQMSPTNNNEWRDGVFTGRISAQTGNRFGGSPTREPSGSPTSKPRTSEADKAPTPTINFPAQPQPQSASTPKADDWLPSATVSLLAPEPAAEQLTRDRNQPARASNPYIPRVAPESQPLTAAIASPIAPRDPSTAAALTTPVVKTPSSNSTPLLASPPLIATADLHTGPPKNQQPDVTSLPPTPARDAKVQKPSGSNSVIVAHEIPAELEKSVRQYVDRLHDSKVHTSWDDRGRLIMQASQERQDDLNQLLKFTSGWRQEIAKQGRVVFSVHKVDGEDVLDLRPAGLSFVRDIRPNRSTPSMPGGICVKEVYPGSPAAWNDIRPGDILDRVGPFRATNVPELASIFKTLQEGTAADRELDFLLFRRSTDASGTTGSWVGGKLPLIAETDEAGALRERPSWRSERGKRQSTGDNTTGLPKQSAGSDSNTQPGSTSINRAHLLYDGKSFDAWRTAWQTELSTEKRVEAVKALASFGANGYGKEAGTALLDIALNYQWPDDGSNVNNLQSALLDALCGDKYGQSIPVTDWFPLLVERAQSGNANARRFAPFVLLNFHKLGSSGALVTDQLLRLTTPDLPELRPQALVALNLIDRQHKNPRIVARFKELLLGKDPQQTIDALLSLDQSYAPLPFDASALLFSSDAGIRRAALQAFTFLVPQGSDAGELLMKVLNDPKKANDHLQAIRAIGRLNQGGAFAIDKLQALMIDHSQPLQIRVAATKALQNISSAVDFDVRLRNDFNEQLKDGPDSPETRRRIIEFEQAMQSE